MIVVALRVADCFKKALNSRLWRKEHSICTFLMIEQTLIALAFTPGQPKPTKLWKKTCNHCPHKQPRHVSRRSRWKHNPAEPRELSARVTDPSGPVLPSCSHKHEETFESNVGRRETCLLAMRVGPDRSRFPGSHVTPGAPARKEVFETALDGHARTQSDVFLVFSRTGNPLVKTVFLRGQRKLTKSSSTNFTLLATIVTIVAEQPNFDAQEAQYTTKTTTSVATEGDEENKQNSEFSLVYFLALFLSRCKCAFFNDLWGGAMTPWSPYLITATKLLLCTLSLTCTHAHTHTQAQNKIEAWTQACIGLVKESGKLVRSKREREKVGEREKARKKCWEERGRK